LLSKGADRAQDEEGKPKQATSDDYACLRLKLVPRLAAQQPPGPSWAHPQGFVSVHVTLTVRGQARIDNRIVISGAAGAAVLSTSTGALTVTDKAGKVT
jgi:hypothetical protein